MLMLTVNINIVTPETGQTDLIISRTGQNYVHKLRKAIFRAAVAKYVAIFWLVGLFGRKPNDYITRQNVE